MTPQDFLSALEEAARREVTAAVEKAAQEAYEKVRVRLAVEMSGLVKVGMYQTHSPLATPQFELRIVFEEPKRKTG